MADSITIENTINDLTFELDNLYIIDVTGYQKEQLEITPSTTQQVFTPEMNKVYDKVTVNAVNSTISPNIKADNILSGVDILGVVGNVTPPDNKSFVMFVDLQKSIRLQRNYVERDYTDEQINLINSLLDKICRTGGY